MIQEMFLPRLCCSSALPGPGPGCEQVKEPVCAVWKGPAPSHGPDALSEERHACLTTLVRITESSLVKSRRKIESALWMRSSGIYSHVLAEIHGKEVVNDDPDPLD